MSHIQVNFHQMHTSVHKQHAHTHHGLDMNAIPANWDLAVKHAQSRETKPEKERSPYNDYEEVCQCCGYEINREKIDLWVDVLELGFLGAGFPLFYNYIKYCIIMLTCLLCIQGLPNIMYNLKGTFCEKTLLEAYEAAEENKEHPDPDFLLPCPESLTNKISLANVLDILAGSSASFHLSTGAMIVQIFLSMFFRRSQRKIEIQVDEQNTTPADYTIWVKRVPKTLVNPKEALKLHFKSQLKNVAKISLVYDIDEIEELEKEYQKLIKEKQSHLSKHGLHIRTAQLDQIEEEMKHIHSKITLKEQEIVHDPSKFTGQAFVSFETEKQKQEIFATGVPSIWSQILNYFLQGGSTERYNESQIIEGQHLLILDAPEPNDIDWEFVHCSRKEKILARTISFFKWIILIAFSFSIICGITYLQNLKIDHVQEELLELQLENKKHNTSIDPHEQHEINKSMWIITILSFVISTTIVLFNKFCLPYLVHHIVDNEKWTTKTKLNISFAFKLTIALFFNTALITVIIEILIFKNFYGIGGGMIYNEELVFVMNALVPSLAWIVDPWSILKNYQRNKEFKNKGKSVLTQGEANEIMEHPDYAMGKRYADIMKTMWFTFFFSPVIPIGTLFSLVGLILYYYTDKYNLIYRRTVKESIGSSLSFEMIELQEYSVLLHCFGNVMFKSLLSGQIDKTSIYLFVFAFIITILPMGTINEFLFEMDKKNETKPYSIVHDSFDTDYDRENPITKHEALKVFQTQRNMSRSITLEIMVWFVLQG